MTLPKIITRTVLSNRRIQRRLLKAGKMTRDEYASLRRSKPTRGSAFSNKTVRYHPTKGFRVERT